VKMGGLSSVRHYCSLEAGSEVERAVCRRPIVYTVGHSGRRLGEFLALLKRYQIRVLVDVRSRPGSRYVPWFNRKNLEKTLPSHGISYVWLGDLLGGLREIAYTEHMLTRDYRVGIGALLALIASSSPVAFMCRERYWLNCHRAYIAETLHRLGVVVLHIVDLGVVERHRPLELEKVPAWLVPCYL